MIDPSAIRDRFTALSPHLDERGRRSFAAVEAQSAGYGGIAAVSRATGIAASTIGRGLDEALSGWQPLPSHGRFSAMAHAPNPYRGFRYPAEVIQHAVWLYHCFSLSLRNVETILAARGIVVSYETIRAWGLRFGRQFANELKQRRPKPGDKWHLEGRANSGGGLVSAWR